MNTQLEEPSSAKPRKRRVVVQRKVSPAEFEELKTKMESMGLDPSKDPVPPSLSDNAPRSSKTMPLQENTFQGLPAAAMGDKYVQPTLTAAALNAQNTKTQVETRTMKGPKMVSLQKRTIEEQIAHGRHERALEKWNNQQAHWENFRHHASKRTGRDKEELVVTKMEEHRERKEVMELLDRATPDEVLSGGYSWYHSLRGEGTRFITVGNMFSGLHLPIKMHKETYVHEIVRKPHLRDIAVHHRTKKEKGKHPRTWRDDEYLQARMRRYWKKMQEHAPGQLDTDELLEPTCIGLHPPEDFDGYGSGGGDDNDGQGEEIFAIDGDPSGLDQNLSTDMADETALPTGELKQGPYIQALPEQLQFQAVVNKLNMQCIKLKNVGTAVIQYEWVLNDPQHGFQESVLPDDPSDRFMCASAKGQVLPGCEMQTLFTFNSSIPGTFISSWRLSTYPDLLEPIDELIMHGIALEADVLQEQRQGFQKDIFKQQVLRQVQELIDDVFEDVKLRPEPLPDLNASLIQERLFEETNSPLGLYWTPHSWHHLSHIGESIGQLKAKSLQDRPVADEGSLDVTRSGSKQDIGQACRGRLPIKKKRGPEGVSHKDLHTLTGVPSVDRLEKELHEVVAPKDSDIAKEKRQVTVELNRAVRGAQAQPLERSPLWWLAHEAVMDVAKLVPSAWASARKSCELAPLPFITPLPEDASPEMVAEHKQKREQRDATRGDEEKESEAKGKFLEQFGQEHFGPRMSKFENIAHESCALTELHQVASKTLQERLGPYAGRSNSESVDVNANVVLYEIDLDFLASHLYLPPDDGSGTRRYEFQLTAEAEELAKQRMQGIPPLLEVSPLAIIVIAHVGRPDPDPPQKQRTAPIVQVGGDAADDEVDEFDVAPGMRSLPSLEPIADLLRDATEGFASAVEFVPHSRWIGDSSDFAAQVRADTSDNKVFLLENMAAIPEEVGIRRFVTPVPQIGDKFVVEYRYKIDQSSMLKFDCFYELQSGDEIEIIEDDVKANRYAIRCEGKKLDVGRETLMAHTKLVQKADEGESERSERINSIQVPWAAREKWAERALSALIPEVFVQDSFSGALQKRTFNAGLWPSQPQKVVGSLLEGEIAGFCDALRLQFGRGSPVEIPPPKVVDGVPVLAPLLMVLGGGGYGGAEGESALIRKLELLLGLAQLAKHERDGICISLGGEFCLVVLACIFGVKLGKLDFALTDVALAALRDTLRDVLSLGVTIMFPPDVVALKVPPPEPEPVAEDPEPKAKAKGKAKAAPTPAAPEPVVESEKPEEENAEDKNVQSFLVRPAFAAMAEAPVSLGFVKGQECFTAVDAEHGTLKLQVGNNTAMVAKPQTPPGEEEPGVQETSPLEVVPEGWVTRDIGEQACEGLRIALRRSRGVLWNGALGMLEDERFQKGTRTFLAHCGYRISGGEDEDEDMEAVDEEEAEEDEDDEREGEGDGEGDPVEKEVEWETSVVIGHDSARMLPSLYNVPAPFAFESRSGETLLAMIRGKSLPGLLACAEKERT
jgi:3-phosphoglycerate kinase